MTRGAWFHCFAGISGDMALGSLVDAGADLALIKRELARLPLSGWGLEAEPVLRGGIAATKVHVHVEPSPVVRTWAHIHGLITEAHLPDRALDRALAVFGALAEVEAGLHRRPVSQVHFHEVGAVDSIIDVVGTCVALEVLGIDEVTSSPVTVGRGMVRAEHGLIPNPAPAVVGLLAGAPVEGADVDRELTTPTGAAIVAALATTWGPLPAMRIECSGFGAGSADPDGTPNATQVVVGELVATPAEPGQPVTLLQANVDDITGEQLAHAVASLLDAGAHDAWLEPVIMKKGRPGHVVCALADPSSAEDVAAALMAATGSFGARQTELRRWPAARSMHDVEVDGHAIRVKVSSGRVKVEHADAAHVASVTGRPVREVVSLAEEAWRGGLSPVERLAAQPVVQPQGDDSA